MQLESQSVFQHLLKTSKVQGMIRHNLGRGDGGIGKHSWPSSLMLAIGTCVHVHVAFDTIV